MKLNMMVILVALIYIGFMIYLANQEELENQKHPLLQAMIYGLSIIIGVWVLSAILFIFVSPDQVNSIQLAEQIERVDKGMATFFVVAGIGSIGLILYSTQTDKLYMWVGKVLHQKPAKTTPRYRSDSSVHRLAIILMIFHVIGVMWTFMMSGGLQGISFSYDSPLNALLDVATNALIYIIIALLGVGWITRRDKEHIIKRLGLRFPTIHDWLAGIGIGILLYIFSIIGTMIWASLVPAEIIAEQTAASQQLFQAFSGSLIFGVILALLTGISEEILFRGALQPIFGLITTSFFFTVIHIQYTLTPAILILFIITLGFGWARNYISTTTSVIAHAIYNFIPILLYTVISNIGTI